MRFEPVTRSLVAPLGVVLVTEAVFIWAMIQGFLVSYWLLGGIAVGSLAVYAALMLAAMPAARLGAELKDGVIRQIGNSGSVVVDAIHRVEYRPLSAEVVMADQGGEVRLSLFSRSPISLLPDAIRGAGGHAPARAVVRSVGDVTAAVFFIGFALVMSTVLVRGEGLSAFAWVWVFGVPVAGAVAAHTTTVRKLARDGTNLVLDSHLRRDVVCLGEASSVRLKVRSKGEFWPRIECIIDAGGSRARRIPASGVNLLSMASLLERPLSVE